MPGQALAIAMLAHMPKRNGDETTWEISREEVRFENLYLKVGHGRTLMSILLHGAHGSWRNFGLVSST